MIPANLLSKFAIVVIQKVSKKRETQIKYKQNTVSKPLVLRIRQV